jgi:DNA-binding beta-propeller fold protein YncE
MTKTSLVSLAGIALCLTVNLLGEQQLATAAPRKSSGYHLAKTVPVGGDTYWDYLIVDPEARRVYITHWTHVVVMDADTYAVVGDIPNTPRIHGVALAPDLGRGFTSNGSADTSTIFDLKTLSVLGTVKTGKAPDGIIYDSVSKRVFTFNGRGLDTTAINAAVGTVVGTIALGGKPETPVTDGTGHIYVNVDNKDKAEIVEIDTQQLTILHRWLLPNCEEPTGLALDRENRLLFSTCQNKKIQITSADTGKAIATPPIGESPDAAAYDPETHLVISSNEVGTLTVIHEDSPTKFTVIDTVATKDGSHTMALDPKTHKIFVPAASVQDVPGDMVPKVLPGTFVILVMEK